MTIITPRGNTTTETAKFIGNDKEITVDTDKHTIVVHDGVTQGGFYSAGYCSRVSAYCNAGRANLTHKTYVKVPYDTAVVDTLKEFNTTDNSFTAKYSGNYNISACFLITTTEDTQLIVILLYKNGSAFKSTYATMGPIDETAKINVMVPLNAGDIITVYAYQGGVNDTADIEAGEVYSNFSVERIIE